MSDGPADRFSRLQQPRLACVTPAELVESITRLLQYGQLLACTLRQGDERYEDDGFPLLVCTRFRPGMGGDGHGGLAHLLTPEQLERATALPYPPYPPSAGRVPTAWEGCLPDADTMDYLDSVVRRQYIDWVDRLTGEAQR